MKKIKIKADKRKAERVEIPIRVSYKIVNKKSHAKEALCNNMGGLGFGLSAKEPLNADDRILVYFRSEKSKQAIRVLCRVVWCLKEKEALFRVGVVALKVSNTPEFIDFICSNMMEHISNYNEVKCQL